MARVALPTTGKDGGKRTGAFGLEFPDGFKTEKVRPGGSVEVDDYHARQIRTSANARVGLISSGQALSIGTRTGRWCPVCRRTWQVWTILCNKCHGETIAVPD